MESKIDLRSKFLTARKQIDIQKISQNIEKIILELDIYKKSNNIMLFYPTKYEINLLGLLADKSKNFYFPKVNAQDLLVCPYSSDVEFKKSSFNINEPCSEPVNPKILDLIFVPALAVDKNNFRLGYGGGFYDKFLKIVPDAFSIVPIAENFVVDYLPVDNFDVPVHRVITDVKKAHY